MRRTQDQIKAEMVKYKVYHEDSKWYGYKMCLGCKKEIKYSSIEKFILLRTIRNLEKENCFCSSCNKKGERNHFFGKRHNKKTIKQISKNRSGKACGEQNSMSNPEYRLRVSEALKEKYASGDLDFLKKIQSNNATQNQANGKLKYAPISKAEKEIKKKLEDLGYAIEPQFGIGSLKYDLYLINYNIIIEYNGDYWHCNPNKYKSDYFNRKKDMFAWELWEQDKRKKEIAEKKGYKLFIIWEADYKFNKEKEINNIINTL